ncbi:hemolysin [Fervidicella metallireducens AeB]|uniref:Hemolysin n=1 Tax=Fervidicella metallireducens AeB TaxID=1403537 RepID=A0A017RVA9_9CLOT|nr:hemolysin III family protein [Fervidicella metallireducens]EYE88592.1 hemolysin [Fervidicella metallireducens AeB]
MLAKGFRDPGSGLSHLIGAVVSVIALVVMLFTAIERRDVWEIVSFSIFGASLIMLYTASSVYHIVNAPDEVIKVLRKLDHSMIYVLIAGTYTPICLILLRGKIGYIMLSVIWFLAITGIVCKMFFMNIPRWIYTTIYIIMGWLVVIAIVPLIKASSLTAVLWLVVGGVFYTTGGIIYILKKPNFIPKWFGFHEIFHIFIMLGSICHFIFIYKFC